MRAALIVYCVIVCVIGLFCVMWAIDRTADLPLLTH